MPKFDKKDDKKEVKDKKDKEDKKVEKIDTKPIYIDNNQPDLTEMFSVSSTPKSQKNADSEDSKLKNIIEKARENDPNKKYTPLLPISDQEKPSTLPVKIEANQTANAEMQEPEQIKDDKTRLILFIGAILGFLIILSLFGGPYSPMAILGFAKPSTTPVAYMYNDITIPLAKNQSVAVINSTEVPIVENKTVELVSTEVIISNWRMEPHAINAKVGEKFTIKITSLEMPFDITIDEFDVKEHVQPGKPATISFIPTIPGPYTIHAIAWSAGRMVEATGTLIVQ